MTVYIPPFAKDREGWGTRAVSARGEEARGRYGWETVAEKRISPLAAHDGAVNWRLFITDLSSAMSLVGEFSIKIYHP
jgi:hypothetical protein